MQSVKTAAVYLLIWHNRASLLKRSFRGSVSNSPNLPRNRKSHFLRPSFLLLPGIHAFFRGVLGPPGLLLAFQFRSLASSWEFNRVFQLDFSHSSIAQTPLRICLEHCLKELDKSHLSLSIASLLLFEKEISFIFLTVWKWVQLQYINQPRRFFSPSIHAWNGRRERWISFPLCRIWLRKTFGVNSCGREVKPKSQRWGTSTTFIAKWIKWFMSTTANPRTHETEKSFHVWQKATAENTGLVRTWFLLSDHD